MEPEKKTSILVIDDEPGLTFTLESTLRSGGYAVTAVDSGRRALEALSAHTFDVVLTDIMLPDIDGMQIIAAVRKQQPTARIVAISGGGSYMTPAEALRIAVRLGASRFLEKPFGRADLLRVIAEATALPPA